MMLEAREVDKTYRMGSVELPVLKGVSLKVDEGAFVGIFGPSGAGKSTLLNLMAGLDMPTRGDIFWHGENLAAMSDSKRTVFRNRQVGIVFQFYHLLPELSALENVMLPARFNGGSTRNLRQRALEGLERVQLEARSDHRPRELSGGEQQRVAIARALINEPKILLCDEPTGNLDSAAGEAVAKLLEEIHKELGTSIVLATHDEALARLAHETVVLRDGRLVASQGMRAQKRQRKGV